jgi:peptide/nickel transport system substrate-binding protein
MTESDYWARANRINRRRFIAGAGVTGLGVVAASTVGCGGGDDATSSNGTQPASVPASAAKRGGELTMARAGNIAFADPQRSSGGLDPIFTRLYAETLLHLDKDKIVGYLAESYEQTDQSTITLHLRKDVKFADGTPLNAAAVKFAVERGKDDKLNAPVRPALALVQSVETPDETTAVLKLAQPNALFLSSFVTASMMVSPTAVQKMGNDAFNRAPVGAGPYIVESIVQDGDSTFKRNPDWPFKAPNGDPLPYFDRVRNTIIPQPQALVAALVSGGVDLINAIDLASVKQVQSTSGVTALEVKSAAWQCLEITTNKAPTDNAALRKAINYAINRDEVNQQLAFGLGQPAIESLSVDSWVYDASLPHYSFDAKKAAESLSQAGFPDGLELKCATYAAVQAEALQAQLAKAKIKLTVENLELSVYQDQFRTKGQYPVGTAGGPTENGEMYQYFLTRYGSKGKYNPGQPQNSDWDTLIAKLETMFDQNARKQAYQEMLKKAYDESYRAWTLTLPVYFGLSKKLQGVSVLQENRTNPDLRLAWKSS